MVFTPYLEIFNLYDGAKPIVGWNSTEQKMKLMTICRLLHDILTTWF